MNVAHKTFVVTGGGNGLGRALVLLLLKKGAQVAAVDIRENYLQETAELAGEKAVNLSTHVVDVADKEAVYQLADEVTLLHGSVDAIINNAGIIQPFIGVEKLSFDVIERVINTNFYGTLYLTKAFLPYLLMRPDAYIVNISSIGGFMPFPGQSVYGASKAAVKLLSEGLYSELLHTNVRVLVVLPGGIATNVIENSGIEAMHKGGEDYRLRKLILTPEQAAKKIIRGIEKNKARLCIGKDAKLLNFLYSINPIFATKTISKKMRKMQY